jgi:hypothetical protein
VFNKQAVGNLDAIGCIALKSSLQAVYLTPASIRGPGSVFFGWITGMTRASTVNKMQASILASTLANVVLCKDSWCVVIISSNKSKI